MRRYVEVGLGVARTGTVVLAEAIATLYLIKLPLEKIFGNAVL
jgi:hypothetical protein